MLRCHLLVELEQCLTVQCFRMTAQQPLGDGSDLQYLFHLLGRHTVTLGPSQPY